MTRIKKIFTEVSTYLEENLQSKYTYHSVSHTQYVFKMATYFAGKLDINKKDTFLIQVAALFHDIGFTNTNIEHEKESNKIAAVWLKKYGFSKEDINKIKGMILATAIPQRPKNILEEIVADADLCYLGTNLFNVETEKLFLELKCENPKLTKAQWNKIQREFISNHTYHTSFCKRYYEHRKQQNLATI